mmetsp:Transcript_52288/g.124731  ORF Transcript_52288/g.124731 Transcript_52288/m.124731 type:complete len:295 (-) Transcript_52288:67-951(-)
MARPRTTSPCILAVASLCVVLLGSSSSAFVQQRALPSTRQVMPQLGQASSQPSFSQVNSGRNGVAAVMLCAIAAAALCRPHMVSRAKPSARVTPCSVHLGATASCSLNTVSSWAPTVCKQQAPQQFEITEPTLITFDAAPTPAPAPVPATPAAPTVAAPLVEPAAFATGSTGSAPLRQPRASRRVGGARRSHSRRARSTRRAAAEGRAERKSIGSRFVSQALPVMEPQVMSFDASKLRLRIQMGLCAGGRSSASSGSDRRSHSASSSVSSDCLVGTNTSCLRIEAPKLTRGYMR